jgi:hypothetical protein
MLDFFLKIRNRYLYIEGIRELVIQILCNNEYHGPKHTN